MDAIYKFNRDRWEALARAGSLFSRPWLDLRAETALARVDPWGDLGSVRDRDVLCLAGGGGKQSAAFGVAGARVTVPALYVAGDQDLVVRFPGMDQLIPNLSRFVPNLRHTIMLPGCGHWTQQERPAEVNAAMLQFLKTL